MTIRRCVTYRNDLRVTLTFVTYLERQKSYGPDKLHWEEAEEEGVEADEAEAGEKIRLKQYVP
jgi:hypothetical protein